MPHMCAISLLGVFFVGILARGKGAYFQWPEANSKNSNSQSA